MKQIIITGTVITICLFYINSYAQEKSLVFFGDSRAQFLANNEKEWFVVSKSKTPWGQRILSDSAFDIIYPPYYWNSGGSHTYDWVWYLSRYPWVPYDHYITIISLGGNDILQAYGKLEENQNWIRWVRMFTDPSYWLRSWFGHKLDPVDELFWLWTMDTVTNEAARNIMLITKELLNKFPTNRIIINDVAPVLKPRVSGTMWSGWDLREFLRVNLYINIYNNKIKTVSEQFSRLRVDFLWTSPVFYYNIFNYYWIDGVHFNINGDTAWGALLSLKLISLGWVEAYTGPIIPVNTDPFDLTPPTISLLPSGTYDSGVIIWGLAPLAPITGDIIINDDRGITGIIDQDGSYNPVESSPTSYTFSLKINTNNLPDGQSNADIQVFDLNNNSTTLRIHFDRSTTGPTPVFIFDHWTVLGRVTINYNSEVL